MSKGLVVGTGAVVLLLCASCQASNDKNVLAYQFIGLVVWTPQLLWALLCWWSHNWRNISFATAASLTFLPAVLLGPTLIEALEFYLTLAWPAYVLTAFFVLRRLVIDGKPD